MKAKLITWAILCLSATAVMAQSNNNEDNVVKIDVANQRAYRPGQALVKFKDDSPVSIKRRTSGPMKVSSKVLQDVINKLGVTDMEQLMPVAGKVKVQPTPRMRRVNGQPMEDRDMSKLYLVNFDEKKADGVREAVKVFEQLDDVEFAEPNYLVYALGSPVSSPLMPPPDGGTAAPPAAFTPNDPLYEQQWGPAAINLPQLWATETQNVLGRRPVIAILDTGVDINHPDLKDNIWTNEAELNGVQGEDDDLNGYTDDLHGWDCVNQTGRLGDWNGHGTHCAGIAAAVQGNGIGIVGANPDALIMPVTVMQSDGVGDVGTIIRGLEYTMTHEVDVISMSIGGYGYSMAYELALGKAYHYSVIVAAAGNDGKCIYPGHLCGSPMFPGAFTFVLGVEASQASPGFCSSCGKGVYPYNANPWRTTFSNLDDDGPIYTDLAIFDEEKLYNYELLAPGTNIISTYPNGRYITMCGTSMATPLAAGAISRLLETKEYSSKELLYGDLIGTANEDSKVLDIMAAYNVTDEDRHPSMLFVSYVIRDSIGGDNDGRFDAGEIVELYPVLRNTWGEAIGIKCSLTTSDNEDTEIIEVLENDVDFGRTLHSYGKERSVNPIRFKINENCVDGRHIRLTLNTTCENGTGETIHQDFVITVENGEELYGIMQKNTTLKAGKHYIITKTYAIPANLTLTIEAGTTIKIHDYAQLIVSEQGRIRAIGTPDKPIIFTKGDLSNGYVPTLCFNDNCVFQYCQFLMLGANVSLMTGGKFTDCVIKDCDLGEHGITGIKTTRCNIIQNTGLFGIEHECSHKNSNIIDNTATHRAFWCDHLIPWYDFLSQWKDYNGCNIYGNFRDYLLHSTNVASVTMEPTVTYYDYPSYLGSAVEANARKGVIDFYNECNDDVRLTTLGTIDLTNMLTQPNAQAHGVVWKILVDGKDAQDEYDEIPPLGVGTHQVDVYFNREMDTSIAPFLSMGVRPPYTQTLINENPSWSEDGKIYTAHITITAKSAFDGINRFYVGEAEDLEHFVIPVERTRFNAPISAAGSKSVGFMAEPGLGRVNLKWQSMPDEEVEDIIGYNLYRYQIDEEGMMDTLRVNTGIIEDAQGQEISFTDYDVIPGNTYYYYYRVMRSNLDSTDPSLTVAATPLTAQKGDANGSQSVTVADVVSEIDYLTDQNPQPFIFEAADVNSDNVINILDVVGTINLVLDASTSSTSSQAIASADYTIEDGMLYMNSPVALAGVQIMFKNQEGERVCDPQKVMDGMENVTNSGAETSTFISFSFNGKTIPAGRHALLRVGDAQIAGVILSDANGREVMATSTQPTIINAVPSEQQEKASQGFFDLNGRKVKKPQKGVYVTEGKKVYY